MSEAIGTLETSVADHPQVQASIEFARAIDLWGPTGKGHARVVKATKSLLTVILGRKPTEDEVAAVMDRLG